MSIIERFVAAIDDEIAEVKRKGRAQRVDLNDGRLIDQEGRTSVYRFDIQHQVRLREESGIVAHFPDGQTISGVVAEMTGGHITLALEGDRGSQIDVVSVASDDAFLLERMKEALGEIAGDERVFSRSAAEAALGLAPVLGAPAEMAPIKELNADQNRAVATALGASVSYVWGPPGTGKTATMSRIVSEMVDRGLNVLIVSNTNLAVDTLLEKSCEVLEDRDVLADGLVVRYGPPVKESMIQAFGDDILPARGFDRRFPEDAAAAEAAEAELSEIRRERQVLAARLVALPELERLNAEADRLRRQITVATAEKESSLSDLRRAELSAARHRADEVTNPGIGHDALAEEEEHKAIKVEEQVLAIDAEIEEAVSGIESLNERIEVLRESLGAFGLELERWQAFKDQLEAAEAVVRRYNERKAEAIRISLAQARIVACTAYQSYLLQLKKDNFDAVLIDEASMMPLPLVYLAAGLANAHVVIAGDFRQLPAVALASSDAVKEWYARDVFVKAGIAAAADKGTLPWQAVALRTQYRMRRAICELINKPFYNGILKTPEGQHEDGRAFSLVPADLVMVDTSGFDPWTIRRASGSRMNPVHALVLAGLAGEMRARQELGPEAPEGGIITAYAAQSDLINAAVGDTGRLLVQPAATIHRYQGSEKDLIAFEVTDARGVRLGAFFRGGHDDTDQRLLNVALSRARRHVMLIGNLDYLSREAVDGSAFAGLLAAFRGAGKRVAAGELLASCPSARLLAESASAAAPRLGEDLRRAQRSVHVFMGSSRLGAFARLLELLIERRSRGLEVSLRLDKLPPEDPAGVLARLEAAGVEIRVASRSAQEQGVVVDRRLVWLLPAAWGRDPASLWLRAEAPGVAMRLLTAFRETSALAVPVERDVARSAA